MKLVFAIEELSGIAGGVERTVVNLANEMSARGHEVTILTFEGDDAGAPFFELSDDVAIAAMGLRPKSAISSGAKRQNVKRRLPKSLVTFTQNIFALKRIITVPLFIQPIITNHLRALSPDVVISFKTHLHRYIVPAARSAGLPVVASEHNAPKAQYYGYQCAIDRHVTWRILRQASVIRIQVPDYAESYPSSILSKCVVVPNAVPVVKQIDDVRASSQPTIINVGRLYFQKDQATLIKAFNALHLKFPNWRLLICGDGDMKEELISLVEGLGIRDKVEIRGEVGDVLPELAKAHIFAFPSLFEGFPNALAEAMSAGLPAIAFADCAGSNSLIEPGVSGLLIDGGDRVTNMTAALERLMDDAELRKTLGHGARTAMQKYAPRIVFDRWEKVIGEAAIPHHQRNLAF